MRLREFSGWAGVVMMTSTGCGHTTDTGAGSGGGGRGGVAVPGDAPATALAFAQSGERLVALGYSSNEARAFKTFRDQKLDVDCDFVPDSTGKLQRCVPSARIEVRFTDAACTQRAGGDWRYATTDAFRRGSLVSTEPSSPPPACPGDAPPHRDSFVLGEQLTEEVLGGPPIPLFALREGRCETAPLIGKVTPALYALEPLPETELVAAELVSVKVSDGLRVTRLAAEDGARLSVGVTLADRTPCELQRDGECVPEPIARRSGTLAGRYLYALNADCSAPAFLSPYPVTCDTPRYAVDDFSAPPRVLSVSAPPAAFRLDLAEPLTPPAAHTCDRVTPTESVSYALAPELDLTGTFPQARRVSRGSEPLHVDWFAIGDHLLLPARVDMSRASPGVSPSAEFVNADGEVCAVWPAEDGSLRCAVLGANGAPNAPLTTFPELKLEPM